MTRWRCHGLGLSAIYVWMYAPRLRLAAERRSQRPRCAARRSAPERALAHATCLSTAGRRRRRRGGPRAVVAVVALAGVAVLAGCGGGSGLTVASMPGAST